MPVSSGRVDRRSRLKRELLDSPGWVAASGKFFSTPQSGFKKSNRRSTLFPDNFSPRRTRRQTIVMSVPVVDLCEETSSERQEAGDGNASNAAPSKRKESNGTTNATSEIQVELMKAPSKRAIRLSAKPKVLKSSAVASKPLPTVEEQPSNSQRQRGRPSKAGSKRTARKKDKENEEKVSESQEPNGESQTHNEFELPSPESEDFEQPTKTKSRRKERAGGVQLSATPMLLLNRVDTNHQSTKEKKSISLESTPTASPTKDADPADDSNLADTSISSLNASQDANTSGRCYIL